MYTVREHVLKQQQQQADQNLESEHARPCNPGWRPGALEGVLPGGGAQPARVSTPRPRHYAHSAVRSFGRGCRSR